MTEKQKAQAWDRAVRALQSASINTTHSLSTEFTRTVSGMLYSFLMGIAEEVSKGA